MQLTDDLMKKHDILSWDVSGSQKKKLPVKSGVTQVECTTGKTSPVKDNVDLKKIWNDILDR